MVGPSACAEAALMGQIKRERAGKGWITVRTDRERFSPTYSFEADPRTALDRLTAPLGRLSERQGERIRTTR